MPLTPRERGILGTSSVEPRLRRRNSTAAPTISDARMPLQHHALVRNLPELVSSSFLPLRMRGFLAVIPQRRRAMASTRPSVT